ncbi:hypothetical protein SBOR_6486 [Sclerotinia borealis F-4128]|uniref:Uncharacterized protein n=1 Tax=Sclerotinia borealis (strain F-4128) TaxID=1432307 RepID=W9CE82_SCLBF|nr:hypothetical protein SBOR_6486 [Sclerotinia borealis F-4128]
MFRLTYQARATAYAAAQLILHNKSIPSTRSVHNVKLLGLHNQLHQPAPEMLRLHGLRLHGASVPNVGTRQVQQGVDVAFYKATMKTFKLKDLHNTLHPAPAEKLSFRGLCLHDHARFGQPMIKADPKTIAEMFPQLTSDQQMATKSKPIDSGRNIDIWMEMFTRYPVESRAFFNAFPKNKVSLLDYFTAAGVDFDYVPPGYTGRPKEELRSSQDDGNQTSGS